MRYREISLKSNSNMWHFQFYIWLKCSLGEVHFAEKPHLNQTSGSEVVVIEEFSKEMKIYPFFFFFFFGCISESMLSTFDWLSEIATHLLNVDSLKVHHSDLCNIRQKNNNCWFRVTSQTLKLAPLNLDFWRFLMVSLGKYAWPF